MDKHENVIGEFTPHTYRITCEREPEVGIAWMACINELGVCALGDTPKDGGENLFRSLKVGGHGKLYEGQLRELGKDRLYLARGRARRRVISAGY